MKGSTDVLTIDLQRLGVSDNGRKPGYDVYCTRAVCRVRVVLSDHSFHCFSQLAAIAAFTHRIITIDAKRRSCSRNRPKAQPTDKRCALAFYQSIQPLYYASAKDVGETSELRLSCEVQIRPPALLVF
jgi:hypothetical protein